MPAPRIAVIGHVEWVTFAAGEVPARGDIAHLREPFAEPGGGGAVTAVQIARLGARTTFFTALASDGLGDRARRFFEREGIEVRAACRAGVHTESLTILDGDGERTIMVVGENQHPEMGDDLGWADLAEHDAVYFTGQDPETLRAARAARVVVVTARRLPSLRRSGIVADALLGSATDPGERLEPGDERRAHVVVRTGGAEGGDWRSPEGSGRYASAPLPGPVADTYGAGDSFLGGTTYGLACGLSMDEALALGARCGAAAVVRRGAYGLAPDERP